MENESDIKYYVDMDGVLVDFNSGIMEEFNLNSEKEIQSIEPENFKALSKDFWNNLSPLLGFQEIFYCFPNANILTAYPDVSKENDNETAIGKFEWCLKYLEICPSQFNIVKRIEKQKFASDESTILIDDNIHNIREWFKKDGFGFYYNGNHESYKQIVQKMKLYASNIL